MRWWRMAERLWSMKTWTRMVEFGLGRVEYQLKLRESVRAETTGGLVSAMGCG